MNSDRKDQLAVALQCQGARAVYDETLEVLRRDVSVQSRPIPILFPEREHVRLLRASSHVETEHAFLLSRGVTQL